MEHEQSVADVLNSIRKANLSSAASRDEWDSVVSDYFCQPSSDTDSCSSDEEQETLQEDEDFELPSVTVDPVREFQRSSSLVVSDCQEEEMEKIARYKCTCQYAAGSPCYTQFSLAEIFQCRLEMTELTPDEKDMMLLGIISCVMDISSTTHRSKKAKDDSHVRQRQRSCYMKNGKNICRDAFMFLYSISKNKLSALCKWYKEHGLSTRKKKSGGRKCNTLSLELDDIKRVVTFISNYAEKNAIRLPGRVATQFRSNVQLLPTSTTKSDVCRLYAESIKETGYRIVGEVTFCRLWHQLLPNVIISRPMTDLCWTCQQLYREIASSSNLPELVKAAKLRKLQEHLDLAQQERSVYQQMIASSRSACGNVLAPHSPCSNPNPCHYSFDFAQQVHLPHDPMQPGPMYFMCPRKVGIFGVCCESIPQQVNFLIDESHCTSKGSISVISYLHYFFEHYGSGECEVDLHCDNCCGQNKNNFVLAYFMWRVLMGLHRRVSVHFLIAGHTKFSPDWCFGLLKQRFRRTAVSSLEELSACIEKSTLTGVNVAQITGLENGPAIVPVYDWQAFLSPIFKSLVGIKSHHHFTFSSDNPGTVVYKEFWHSDEKHHMMLKIPVTQVPRELPTPCPSPGLPLQRQWYLWDTIRDFCPVTSRDILCPKPKLPKPKPGVSVVEATSTIEPAAAASVTSGRGRGQSRGRGRECDVSVVHQATLTVETTATASTTSARGRGRGQSRGRGLESVVYETTTAAETSVAESATSTRSRGRGRGRGRGRRVSGV